MIRVVALVLLGLVSLLANVSTGHSVSGQGMRIVRTADLFHDLHDYKRDAKSDKKFVLDGKVYHAKYETSRPHISVSFMDDAAEAKTFEIKGERDYYYDLKNHATFTVSRRPLENGAEKRSLRANILLPETNEHLVLEPHEESEMNQEGFHMYSKIYKASNSKGLSYDIPSKTVNKDFIVAPSPSNNPATPGAVNNVVELFMVADNWYYQSTIKKIGKSDDNSVATYIEAYFAEIENLASLCYQRSLASTANLKLSVVVTHIYICKSSSSSPFTGSQYYTTVDGNSVDDNGVQYIYATNALNALNSWATTIFKGQNYDAVVGITSTNIVGDDNAPSSDSNEGVVGLSPIGGVCQSGYNAFIVEEWQDFSGAYVVAHELGHNLGAQHDDYYNDASCTDEDYYIMAPSNEPDNFQNSFYFSPCSIRIFVQNIYTKNRASCLANIVQPDSDIARFSSFFPGQVYNLTQQCQMTFGPTYFGDFEQDSDDPDSQTFICENIYCTTAVTYTQEGGGISYQRGYMTGRAAYERTSCGNGKWCVAGQCVQDPAAPTGDIPVESQPWCAKVAKVIGKSTLCSYVYGVCYQFCNPGSTVVKQLSGQTMANWLSTNNVANTNMI